MTPLRRTRNLSAFLILILFLCGLYFVIDPDHDIRGLNLWDEKLPTPFYASRKSVDLPTSTSIETTIPGNNLVYGFGLLDRLYLRKGTFYIVTSTPSAFPPREHIIARPLDMRPDQDLSPTDQELQIIDPEEATKILGEQALVVEGFTLIAYDTEQFMSHIFGQEWRDPPGLNAGLMRATFPSTSIENADQWDDLAVLDKTFVFERAMVVCRRAAQTQYVNYHYEAIASLTDPLQRVLESMAQDDLLNHGNQRFHYLLGTD
ncbi:hypothetical protein C0992_005290 [Termitomyces sp. T32_za158]|nr:hypothetical protein C0992_005290 [Termitomyces sp. T32_za158]